MTSQSNLAEIISLMGRCNDDEIRQVIALGSIRLGIQTVIGGVEIKSGQGVAVRSSKSTKGGPTPQGGSAPAGMASGGKRKKKGNPSRKSQYATHPVYKAYFQAKKAVEAKAKADKISFNQVEGPLQATYKEAFNQWLKAKEGFRARRESKSKTGQKNQSSAARKGGGDDSSRASQNETASKGEGDAMDDDSETPSESPNRPPREDSAAELAQGVSIEAQQQSTALVTYGPREEGDPGNPWITAVSKRRSSSKDSGKSTASKKQERKRHKGAKTPPSGNSKGQD